MKRVNILILAVLFAGIAFGQQVKRETIKRITQADKSLEWYKIQKNLWKKEVDRNPKSEEAWWNYYEALRGELHKLGGNPFTEESPAMKIVNEMEKHIPNTFTFYHCKSNQLGKVEGYEKYLIKAYEMQPNNPLTYENLIVYYEMTGNIIKRKEIVNKLYKYGNVSIGLLNQCYNTLISIDKGGVVITGGDNDTYPLWILQDVFNCRTDVTIANRWMIKDLDYLKIMFNRLGYIGAELNKLKIEYPSNFTPKDHSNHTRDFVKLVNAKTNRKIYLAQSAWKNGIYGLADQFYNVGLVFQYSTIDIDNVALTKRNFFKRYKMDYILNAFYKESKPDMIGYSNGNYAPGLLTIYHHAKESENEEEMKWAKTYLDKIAENSTTEIKNFINYQLK